MEVVAEAGAQQPWDQFKEEVEIMEEEHGGGGGAGAVEELLTREIRRRLDHAHGSSSSSSNGNGAHHANAGEEEEEDDASGGEQGEEEEVEVEEVKVAPEEEEQRQQNKSIFLDPAKVPDIITEVTARYLVTGTMQSGAEKEDTNETLTPKGKEHEAHENGNAQEINHGTSNGKLENGSHSNGSHQAPNGSEPKIAYTFKINRTQIYPTEVDKDGQVAEAQPKVEEYDLEKILDEQETYDLFCPNCDSCITRRVILKKRKRPVRTSPLMNRQRDRILKDRCLLFLYLIGLRKNHPTYSHACHASPPSFQQDAVSTYSVYLGGGMWTKLMFCLLLHQRTRLLALKIAQAGFCLVSRQEIAQTDLILLIQRRCHCCPVHRALAIQPQ